MKSGILQAGQAVFNSRAEAADAGYARAPRIVFGGAVMQEASLGHHPPLSSMSSEPGWQIAVVYGVPTSTVASSTCC